MYTVKPHHARLAVSQAVGRSYVLAGAAAARRPDSDFDDECHICKDGGDALLTACAMLLCADGWRTLRAWLSHASPQAFGFATFVPRPQCHILMFTVKAKSEEGRRCARSCVEWSAVAFSTDLGLRSEVGHMEIWRGAQLGA